jgi:hypothetical protein
VSPKAVLPDREDTDAVLAEVKEFMDHFEERLMNSPIAERKLLIKHCVSRILVDRDRGVVRFIVREIPTVSEPIRRFYEAVEAKMAFPVHIGGNVVRVDCRGGRSFSIRTTQTELYLVDEMDRVNQE